MFVKLRSVMLVSKFLDFRNNLPLKCPFTLEFTCPINSFVTFHTSRRTIIQIPFEEDVVVFLFLFHIFVAFDNLWFILLQGQFLILRTRCCLDLNQLLSALLKRYRYLVKENLTPKFIRFPHTLVVYGVAQSIPLEGVDREFSFSRMKHEDISHVL